MKTIKQILESHNIKEDTLYHNHSYVYSDIYDAMLEFGAQSFKGAKLQTYSKLSMDGACDRFDHFSEYLKQVEND